MMVQVIPTTDAPIVLAVAARLVNTPTSKIFLSLLFYTQKEVPLTSLPQTAALQKPSTHSPTTSPKPQPLSLPKAPASSSPPKPPTTPTKAAYLYLHLLASSHSPKRQLRTPKSISWTIVRIPMRLTRL